MKGAFALLLLIALSAWSQPIYRNFFTTNPAPVVQVTPGTNAQVTFSTTGTDTRSYRVDIPYQTWLTNGFPWGALYDPLGAATAATNGYPWTNIPTSSMAASNLTSGGQIPVGTLFDYTTNEQGWLLVSSSGSRHRTFNAGALTNVVASGYLPLTGGTVTGPVLSTSSSTNAPAINEFPVAGWVRSLFNNGMFDYSTTNVDLTATNPGSGQVMYTFATTIPSSTNRTYVAPNAGDYIGSVMTTNTFTFLQGPIAVNAYLAALGGSGNPSVSIHPEIYYSYDKTNWYGDWEAANQTLNIGVTNLYQFVVAFPAITATNAGGFYIERRYKIGSAAGATHPNVVFLIGTNTASGTNDASHIAFSAPNSAIFSVQGTNVQGGGSSAGQLLTSTGTGSAAWSNAPAAVISTSGASNQLAFFSFNGASAQWENPARTIYIYQDFRSGRAGGSMWNYANGGSGGTSSSATYTLDGFPCADDFYFYVNASPSWSTYNTIWRFGKSAGSVEVWELGVKTGNYLSTGTNLYMMIVGANDNNGSGSYPANGAFFQYNGVTNTWQCVLAKSSSYTTNYTSVANVASSNFRFTIISDASTNVTWYINGTSVATVSTASLSPTVGLGGMVLGQSSGTGGFANINDPFLGFVAFYQKLGTSR